VTGRQVHPREAGGCTGLVGTATGTDGIPFESFRDGRFVNEGILAEQFVAQHLLHMQHPADKPKL